MSEDNLSKLKFIILMNYQMYVSFMNIHHTDVEDFIQQFPNMFGGVSYDPDVEDWVSSLNEGEIAIALHTPPLTDSEDDLTEFETDSETDYPDGETFDDCYTVNRNDRYSFELAFLKAFRLYVEWRLPLNKLNPRYETSVYMFIQRYSTYFISVEYDQSTEAKANEWFKLYKRLFVL